MTLQSLARGDTIVWSKRLCPGMAFIWNQCEGCYLLIAVMPDLLSDNRVAGRCDWCREFRGLKGYRGGWRCWRHWGH